MAKSPDAFRTISEVSDWLDTPAHVLRFWESKFTQVKPVKRAGGRRYYRPEDMALLGGIKTLLHEQGMTIKGVQKLLREQGARHVSALGPQPLDDGGQTIATDFTDLTIEHDAAAAEVSADAAPVAKLRSGKPVPGVAPRRTGPSDESGQPFEGETEQPLRDVPRPPEPKPEPKPRPDPMDPWPQPPPPPENLSAALAPPDNQSAALAPPGNQSAALAPEGLLSIIVHADPARLRARRARIAPLVQRLDRLRERMQRDCA